MRTKLAAFWYGLRTSYWFVPTLMTAAAIGLAFVMLSVDRTLEQPQVRGRDGAGTVRIGDRTGRHIGAAQCDGHHADQLVEGHVAAAQPGTMAMPRGMLPTGIAVTTALVFVSITETDCASENTGVVT